MTRASLHHDPSRPLPAVDEHLVMPGSGFEILDGKVFEVPPALEPHAERTSKLAALLEAHVRDDFNVAIDMLTRTDRLNDFAPDASVYPRARHPETGGRQLEQLAFEIVSTETMGHAATKAAKLIERGVRRVFALDIEGQQALEWSTENGAWRRLPLGDAIDDPCFAVALPVVALVMEARSDDTVAEALLGKGNRVLREALHGSAVRAEIRGKTAGLSQGLKEGRETGLREGKAEGLREGKAEGLREGKAEGLLEGQAREARRAVERVLGLRGLALSTGQRERLAACEDLEVLQRWLDQALSAASADDVLG